jgi:hypothetical protein
MLFIPVCGIARADLALIVVMHGNVRAKNVPASPSQSPCKGKKRH